jgi:hypothetical protein
VRGRAARSDVARLWDQRRGAAAAALGLSFLALYVCSVDLDGPNVLWHNLVFDADLDRVAGDVAERQTVIAFERHPLFVTLVAWPASALVHCGLELLPAVRLVVAAASALGVVAAREVFLRIVRDRATATLLAILYGVGAAIWLFGSLPETPGLNAAFVAAAFYMHDPSFGRPLRHPVRFGAAALVSALAVGATVSNLVYVALACASNSRRAQRTWLRRLATIAAHAAAAALAFWLLSSLQLAVSEPRVMHPTGVVRPWDAAAGDPFLDVARGFSLPDVTALVRAFVVDSIVAPPTALEVVDTRAGPNHMIQFRGVSTTQLAALVAITLAAGAGAFVARRPLARLVRSHDAQLAMCFVAHNLVLHHVYRANGQPFLFTAHAVLATLVLFAHLHATGSLAVRRAVVCVATLAVAINSAQFVGTVGHALRLPCVHRANNVCTSWAPSTRLGDE